MGLPPWRASFATPVCKSPSCTSAVVGSGKGHWQQGGHAHAGMAPSSCRSRCPGWQTMQGRRHLKRQRAPLLEAAAGGTGRLPAPAAAPGLVHLLLLAPRRQATGRGSPALEDHGLDLGIMAAVGGCCAVAGSGGVLAGAAVGVGRRYAIAAAAAALDRDQEPWALYEQP